MYLYSASVKKKYFGLIIHLYPGAAILVKNCQLKTTPIIQHKKYYICLRDLNAIGHIICWLKTKPLTIDHLVNRTQSTIDDNLIFIKKIFFFDYHQSSASFNWCCGMGLVLTAC
jgi:hypothetical protein